MRLAATGNAAARSARSPEPTASEAVAAHRDDSQQLGELWGITELCAEFGVSPRAVRFYEDKGLLAPRRVNGMRVYTRRDRARLGLILRAKALGSSLAEIRHFLDMYGAHGEGRTQQLRYLKKRTDEAIAELERKRHQIDATLAELRLINDHVNAALAAKA